MKYNKNDNTLYNIKLTEYEIAKILQYLENARVNAKEIILYQGIIDKLENYKKFSVTSEGKEITETIIPSRVNIIDKFSQPKSRLKVEEKPQTLFVNEPDKNEEPYIVAKDKDTLQSTLNDLFPPSLDNEEEEVGNNEEDMIEELDDDSILDLPTSEEDESVVDFEDDLPEPLKRIKDLVKSKSKVPVTESVSTTTNIDSNKINPIESKISPNVRVDEIIESLGRKTELEKLSSLTGAFGD